MKSKAYDMMNWREIEGILYSDIDYPYNILGPKDTKKGLLIQTFKPDAVAVSVVDDKTGKKYPMELMDEAGYFALLIPKVHSMKYKIEAEYEDKSKVLEYDAYAYKMELDEKDVAKFKTGINYEVYNMLGAHTEVIDGVVGTRFAVWAPFALRVSVVGDFNNWDGRAHMMQKHYDAGIFYLFIPGVKPGDIYKYEVLKKGNNLILKCDPYGFESELRPANASIVSDIDGFKWTDSKWIKNREKTYDTYKEDQLAKPINIYEVHLGSWKKTEDDEFLNYREIAKELADYVKEMGYTHIELMPVMEHPLDESWGYQVTGYYAPTKRYGNPDDFMYFMNYMHNEGIGVILDWVPAHFPRDAYGMAEFDGSCLYEHEDPRQGTHPDWGTLIYNYGRPEVSNFLIANALFWVEKYHADGIRMDAVASMLYLDYGKSDGQWVANMYGGNENLDAMEFIKHLNSIMHKRNKGVFMIAEESTAWPNITTDIEEDGLGFDFKWNMGWMNDTLRYMQTDPYFRHDHYGELIFSMVYAYSEKFVLVLSHDEVVHGKKSLIEKMPGDFEDKLSNFKAMMGYYFTHPGKKLLFMGQEFAQSNEWWEAKELDWFSLDIEYNKAIHRFIKDINKLYLSEKALYELDEYSEGFEWINNISTNESIIVFVRNGVELNDKLLVVCNFDTIPREDYKIGVPATGSYKEIFNSDNVKYGGKGFVNPRAKKSKVDECDGRRDSIRIKVPALGFTVLRFIPPKKN